MQALLHATLHTRTHSYIHTNTHTYIHTLLTFMLRIPYIVNHKSITINNAQSLYLLHNYITLEH